MGIVGCAALLAGGVAAGSALASGHRASSSPQTLPKPDPPPPPPPVPHKPPPPPPPPARPPPPPPPAVIVQVPPAPVRHKRPKPKPKKAVPRKRTVVSHPLPTASKPPAGHPQLALGSAPVTTTAGGSSPALLIIGFGVLLGLLGAGVAFAPRALLPPEVSFRLEPYRQTILVTGLAIAVACVLVGLLTALAG